MLQKLCTEIYFYNVEVPPDDSETLLFFFGSTRAVI